MKFRYTAYEVSVSSTILEGIVYRPEVTIQVLGPGGKETIRALLDTGSDETVLPASLAEALGIELDYEAVGLASGVGGHEVQLAPGKVTLKLSQGDEDYRWQLMAAFLKTDKPEDEVALLGYAGFLEFFQATFDSELYEVTLVPNDRFRREKLEIASSEPT